MTVYLRTMQIAAAVLFFLCASVALAQGHADSCQAQIPRSLADALAKTFPGYRAPLEYDNAPDDTAKNRSEGGTGCLGVGIGDLTGEGKKQYVLGLTALKGSGGFAVIALPRKGGWRFQKIPSGAENARFRQYVDVVDSGRYERPNSTNTALGADEKPFLDCPNSGARAGTLGGSSFVYCYIDGRWLHVRVSGP
ncbi:MAG TPA: hypothetical protein VEK74_09785 [Burkholderiaceae bacterium]|nr:hypothetical protein [Burkholderiaceae bacterium]